MIYCIGIIIGTKKNYNGPDYNLPDGTCVIGGGLASIDVVKMAIIEIAQKALKTQKGVNVDLFTFEKKGVAKILEDYGKQLPRLF